MSVSLRKSALEEDVFELLGRAIRRRYGEAARIENIVVPTLGGSNRTIVFDVVDGSARRRLVSRQEGYTAENTPFLPPSAQFHVMRIAYAHKVLVPEPIFEYDAEDNMGQGYVTAFVEGDTLPNRILKGPEFAAARPRLVAQCAETFALLHSVDIAKVSFLENVPDSLDPLQAQRTRMDWYGEAHPALELGLRWLERHRPDTPERRLLHGDFRVGNLMVGPDGLRAVLDWECSHLGAPAEDLGWLCTRSWRFGQKEFPVGGFGAREDLIAAYAAAGGKKIDVEEIRYWEIFGLVRWAIINIMQAHGHVFGGRRSLSFAACGRNVSTMEYDLLITLAGHYD